MNTFSQAVLFLFAIIVVEMAIIAPHEVLPLHKLTDPGYCNAPNVVRPRLIPGFGRHTYPIAAVRRNEEGATVVDFLVEKNGTVHDVKIMRWSGYSDLDEATKAATLAQRYYPATLEDRPVACRKLQRIVWKLTDSGNIPGSKLPFINVRNMGRSDYPPQGIAKQEQGTVKIIVVIDENGKIVHSEVTQSSGFNDLDMASLEKVASDPHIVPASLSGKPLRSVVFFEFDWSLTGQNQPPTSAKH